MNESPTTNTLYSKFMSQSVPEFVEVRGGIYGLRRNYSRTICRMLLEQPLQPLPIPQPIPTAELNMKEHNTCQMPSGRGPTITGDPNISDNVDN